MKGRGIEREKSREREEREGEKERDRKKLSSWQKYRRNLSSLSFTRPALERVYYPMVNTGLNIANKIKYIYYSFSITKLKKFHINRIFTPERESILSLDYDTKLSGEIITRSYHLVYYRDTAYLKLYFNELLPKW